MVEQGKKSPPLSSLHAEQSQRITQNTRHLGYMTEEEEKRHKTARASSCPLAQAPVPACEGDVESLAQLEICVHKSVRGNTKL